MVVISGIHKGIGIEIRKKLGSAGSPDPKGMYGIYQVRTRFGRRTQVKEKFYTPTNPQTPAQQANRQKFANGVTAWNNLTDQQKAVYNEKAKRENFYGYNIFMREYLLSH